MLLLVLPIFRHYFVYENIYLQFIKRFVTYIYILLCKIAKCCLFDSKIINHVRIIIFVIILCILHFFLFCTAI